MHGIKGSLDDSFYDNLRTIVCSSRMIISSKDHLLRIWITSSSVLNPYLGIKAAEKSDI